MLWYLLFAHFIADYPLQSNWIARNKDRAGVLLLHVATHMAVLLVILIASGIQLWSYFLVLAAVHFVLDYGKNALRKLRPQWIAWPYLLDQALHILTIVLVSLKINQDQVPFTLPVPTGWVIYATGYIIVTIAWFISERVLTIRQTTYQKQVNVQFWPRMLARALMFTVFLLLGNQLILTGLASGMAVFLPYTQPSGRRRAVLTDIAVSFCTAALVLIAQ